MTCFELIAAWFGISAFVALMWVAWRWDENIDD